MSPKDDKPAPEPAADAKNAPPQRFDATLPIGRKNPPDKAQPDLDLDLGDIQSRLPYGSEDIADK